MGLRLSSTCKCGPNGHAKHEVGKCPETNEYVRRLRENKPEIHVVETPKGTGVVYTQGTQVRYKPPWEK